MVHTSFRIPWPFLALGFAVGHRAGIRLPFGKEGHRANLADAVLIPSLVFAGAGWVVVATVAGTLAYAVWVRRSVLKASFNVCSRALATSVAIVVFHAVAGPAAGLSTRVWLAAVLAVIVVGAVGDATIQIVIAISGTGSGTAEVANLVVYLLVVAGLDSTLGATAVLMMSSDPIAGGILFLAAGLALGVFYTAYGRLRIQHANLKHLYRFNQALAGLVEADDVVRAVLTEARAVLNAGLAQLVVVGSSGVISHTWAEGDERPRTTVLSTHPLIDQLAGSEAPLLANRRDSPRIAGLLDDCGWRDALAVRLPGGDDGTELLVVANRLGERLSFDRADVALIAALASQSAVALRSSRLHAIERHQASHDALTGLPNRILFAATLDEAIDSRSRNTLIGVMFMDLDGFKEVNDTLGHDVGDLLLQQLAVRLRSVVTPEALIARLGGDEFAVALPNAHSLSAITAMADQLSLSVQSPLWVADTPVEMRASIGVAVAPLHGEDRSTLMRRADMTMYRAKQRGGGVAIHDSRDESAPVRHPSLLSELREAIRAGTLSLSYQPVADTRTGQVTGAEALLRWTHPVYGPITPDQFIPLAERSGLIRPLTRWVLDTGLGQLADWRRHLDSTLTLSINLSPSLLDDADIVAEVRQALQRHRLSPAALTLELTESPVGGDHTDDHHVLDQLAGLGVRLSIDDYGTGYSSLHRLLELPFKELKIDKTFIDRVATSMAAAAIVGSTVALAQDLGITVVAEGVETDQTWVLLRQMRCTSIQGFVLSPGLPAAAFADWLAGRPEQSNHGDNIITLR